MWLNETPVLFILLIAEICDVISIIGVSRDWTNKKSTLPPNSD